MNRTVYNSNLECENTNVMCEMQYQSILPERFNSISQPRATSVIPPEFNSVTTPIIFCDINPSPSYL